MRTFTLELSEEELRIARDALAGQKLAAQAGDDSPVGRLLSRLDWNLAFQPENPVTIPKLTEGQVYALKTLAECGGSCVESSFTSPFRGGYIHKGVAERLRTFGLVRRELSPGRRGIVQLTSVGAEIEKTLVKPHGF